MADGHTFSNNEQLHINTVLQLIAAAFGMFENCLVILMYTKYVADRRGCRYFIPILALVDLGGCLSILTQLCVNNMMTNNYPSVFSCKMMTFLIVLTGVFFSPLIFAIALQRYLVFCSPSGLQMNKKVKKVVIFILFLMSVGYATPILKFDRMFHRKLNDLTGNLSVCFINHSSDNSIAIAVYLGLLLLLSLINIVVTSLLCIPVIKTIYERPNSCRQHRTKNISWRNIEMDSNELHMVPIGRSTITNSPQECYKEPVKPLKIDRRTDQKETKHISVMFLVTIAIYIVSYLTSLVTLIYSFARYGYLTNIYVVCLRFNLLNHIANPYVYWFFDHKLRKELRWICYNGFFRR